MLSKELEKSGIPTVHICALTQVAEMVGSSRIVPAISVVSPLGNPNIDPKEEKLLRRRLIEEALRLLQK